MTNKNPPPQMSPLASELFEKHVAFELAAWSGPLAPKQLERLLESLYDYVAQRSLEQVLPEAEALRLAREILLRGNPPKAAEDLGREILLTFLEGLEGRPELVSEIVGREAFLELVEVVIRHEGLRVEVVHALVNNQVFGMLIAEVLYTGIQDFAKDNKLAQSIPGAQSLLKLGQNFLNQTVPGLGEGFERNVKEFIRNNADRMARSSEEFLNRSLKPDVLRDAAAKLWDDNQERSVRELVALLREGSSLGYEKPAAKIAQAFRESSLASGIVDLAVRACYGKLAALSLGEIAGIVGLEREVALSELQRAGTLWLSLAREGGFLENQLRARLSDFYQSAECQAILG